MIRGLIIFCILFGACNRAYAQTTLADLLEAVHARLDDDGPRLVLADWYEENGDPDRAQFIRGQIRLNEIENSLDRYSERNLEIMVAVQKEISEVWYRNPRWRKSLRGYPDFKLNQFRRGFPYEFEFRARRMNFSSPGVIATFRKLMTAFPTIQSLDFSFFQSAFTYDQSLLWQLMLEPQFAHIEKIENAEVNAIPDKMIDRFKAKVFALKHIQIGVSSLSEFAPITAEQAQMVFSNVETMSVGSFDQNGVILKTFQNLINAAKGKPLRLVQMGSLDAFWEAVQVIEASGRPVVELSGDIYTEEMLERLTTSKAFQELQSLELGGHVISKQNIGMLARFRKLRRLVLIEGTSRSRRRPAESTELDWPSTLQSVQLPVTFLSERGNDDAHVSVGKFPVDQLRQFGAISHFHRGQNPNIRKSISKIKGGEIFLRISGDVFGSNSYMEIVTNTIADLSAQRREKLTVLRIESGNVTLNEKIDIDAQFDEVTLQENQKVFYSDFHTNDYFVDFSLNVCEKSRKRIGQR